MAEDIRLLLKKFKIFPRNISLYNLAVTHSSFNGDANTKHKDYERLEYMGDAVLGFVSANLIFKMHPEFDQGTMTKLRSSLVKSESLANYARQIELDKYILVGKSINPKQIKDSNKILEDVFEALIGAIYLDKGIYVCKKYITYFLKKDILNAEVDDLTDYKSRLQEEMQAEHRDSVTYDLISQTGPANDRTFFVKVSFNGILLARGKGKTKKAAEQDAAKKALKKKAI